MREYLDILRHVLSKGTIREDRTGVGTIGVFGYQARFDMRDGTFPLVTTKKMFWRGIVAELLWFLSGSTDAGVLQAQGVHIWDAWATAEKCAEFGRRPGDLGPVYGSQWRNFGQSDHDRAEADGFDQIAATVAEIRRNPNSRRLVVSAWNPVDASRVALPPCHTLFQFYVQDGELSCHLYARSIDTFIGLPFNIASYALLVHLMAHATGTTPGELVISFGDLHIYRNHLEQVEEQLSRKPFPAPLVGLEFSPPAPTDIFAIRPEHIKLVGYSHHSAIKGDVAI